MESITSTYHGGTPAPEPGGSGGSGGSRGPSILAGAIGGLVVAVVFAALLALGVIDGETRTVVQQGAGAVNAEDGSLMTVSNIYKQASPGVVSIKTRVSTQGTENVFGLPQEGVASGTGVVVDKRGFIVTNAHVVDSNTADPTVQFKDKKSVSAKIVGRDPSNDIAVLKVDPKKVDLKPLPLGDSGKVEVGAPVVAIGSPFGLDQTVTTGIVSALQRQITAPNNFTIGNVIQTDAAINPGNSGGPLLDATGAVIGINSQIATSGTSEGNVGIGFAVPIDTVKSILPQLEKKGKIEYAYLGVSTQTLDPEVAGRFNLGSYKEGALVACVVEGGPAAKAGMTAGADSANINGRDYPIGGDLIVKIDGKPVRTNEDVSTLIVANKPGDTVTITVVREGKEKTLSAKLGTRPANTQNNCSRTGGR